MTAEQAMSHAIRVINNGSGDFDQLVGLLVSDPIKHGAARKVLPEDVYARLFHVERKTTLEQGKPKLQSVNERFLTQQPRDAARSK